MAIPCNSDVCDLPPSGDSAVGVLVSGGIDSCALVAGLLDRGRMVQPLHVKSDLCWHREELRALDRFLGAIQRPGLASLVTLEMPMADLYGDHWSVTGRGTPRAGSPDSAVYLPGRNALLAIKAALWCQLHGIRILALASLNTNPFADATPAFFADFQRAVRLPDTPPVQLTAPLAGMSKREVMRSARDYPLHLTFSCIAPAGGLHCGTCNKCAERQGAFRSAGLTDPSIYANRARARAPQ